MSVVQAIGRKLLKGGVKKPAPPITKLSVKVKKPTPDQPVGKLTPIKPEQPVGKLTPTAPKDRLLKAKDDGFDIDTVFYHATDSDITAFIPSVRGTFFTQDTGFATRFITDELNPSRNIGNNIIPVYLKKGKNFDYETADVDEIFKELKFKGRLDEGTIQQIKLGKWEEIESAPVQDILKRKGYDSYYVKEGDTKNLAVFDPKNIRSVNAKFEDPTSSNILAGGVGVAGIASDKEQPVGKLTPVDSN